MKKLMLLLFIPLVFTCSSDSSDDNQQDNNNFDNYPKLISFTQERPNECEGIRFLVEYSYSGDKILTYSYRQYWAFYNGECNYFGDDGYIPSTVNNVYSGNLLISQNVFSYNLEGDMTYRTINSYEYDENGLLNKWIKQRLDNNDVIIDVDEMEVSWTNDNLTRQMTDIEGNFSITNYDSNYNILNESHYDQGQIISTRTYSYDMTQFDPLANSHKFWWWNGAGPRSHNLWVSQTYNYEGGSYDTFREIVANEYGFPISNSQTRSNDTSYIRIYNYNYE